MPRIADYSVASDGGVFLTENSEVHVDTFGINDDAHLGSPGVFIARLHFTKKSTNFEVSVRINGTRIFKYPDENTEEAVMTIHEVLQPGVLKRGTNQVLVDTGGGDGRVFVSDMYVMFQRDI